MTTKPLKTPTTEQKTIRNDGGKFDDDLYYRNKDSSSSLRDAATLFQKDVELSQQHGRKPIEGKPVDRPDSSYGWEGSSDKTQIESSPDTIKAAKNSATRKKRNSEARDN